MPGCSLASSTHAACTAAKASLARRVDEDIGLAAECGLVGATVHESIA